MRISTVFLGMPPYGSPLMFETMIFGGAARSISRPLRDAGRGQGRALAGGRFSERRRGMTTIKKEILATIAEARDSCGRLMTEKPRLTVWRTRRPSVDHGDVGVLRSPWALVVANWLSNVACSASVMAGPRNCSAGQALI